MPSAPIPLTNNQQSQNETLAGASPVAINILTDGKGAVRMRPGLVAHPDYTSTIINGDPVTGLRYTVGGALYAATQPDGGAVIGLHRVGPSAAVALGTLTGTGRPMITETESILAIAAGIYPSKIELTSDIMSVLANAFQCSHMAACKSILLSNSTLENKNFVYMSDLAAGSSFAGFETWDPAWYVSADVRPDPTVAIADNGQDLFAFGTSSMAVLSPDPSSGSFAPAASHEYGCAAPYSVIRIDAGFGWLDDKMRFVLSDGRTVKVISDDLSLAEITTTADCFAYRVTEGAYDVVVWTFPTHAVSYAFDLGSATWSMWHGRNLTTGGWGAFPVRSHANVLGTADNLVGLSSGQVVSLARTAYSDLGTPIRAYVETGHLSRNTDAKKFCRCVRVALRRGQTASATTAPTLLISYRDDLGPWSHPISVSLGVHGDTAPVVELRSLGTYRRRQWRFVFEADEELVLVSATEEFDVLGE